MLIMLNIMHIRMRSMQPNIMIIMIIQVIIMWIIDDVHDGGGDGDDGDADADHKGFLSDSYRIPIGVL